MRKKSFKDADHQISSYIQGQILVAICIGIMVSIGFYIIGMKYALLLGVLAMFTSVVPYLRSFDCHNTGRHHCDCHIAIYVN